MSDGSLSLSCCSDPSIVCFFVFDQDKHGYFETDELKLLMNILHRVEKNDTVKVLFHMHFPSCLLPLTHPRVISKFHGNIYNSAMMIVLILKNLRVSLLDKLSVALTFTAEYHKQFPKLFQPAFTLQINMRRYFMGQS